MDNQKVKGTYFRSTVDFTERRFSPAERQQILSRLPPAARDVLSHIDRSAWYPLPFVTSVFHGIEEVNADPARTVADVRACGKFIASEAANTFLKLLIRVLTPKLFARQFPDFWRKYNSFGDLRTDLSTIDENRVRFSVEGYDYVHCIGAGWIEFVFEALGKKDIVVESNVPLGTRTLPEIVWNVSWR